MQTLEALRRGDETYRVECHPHRPKVLAGEVNTISTRISRPGFCVDYLGYALIDDPEFTVAPAGLQRAKDEGVRNVHAFVRGNLTGWLLDQDLKAALPDDRFEAVGWVKVTYNPFKRDHFFEVTVVDGTMVPGRQVIGGDTAVLRRGDCWVLDPTYA